MIPAIFIFRKNRRQKQVLMQMILLANIAIPTVAEHVIIMFPLLIPVVLIEGGVFAARHSYSYWESLVLTLGANLKSTLVGLPMGYIFAMLGVIPLGMFATLLPDDIKSPLSNVLIKTLAHGATRPNKYDEFGFFAGTLLVLIPYYILTVHVEYKTLLEKTGLKKGQLKKTVVIMNGITYALLGLPVLFGVIRAARVFFEN